MKVLFKAGTQIFNFKKRTTKFAEIVGRMMQDLNSYSDWVKKNKCWKEELSTGYLVAIIGEEDFDFMSKELKLQNRENSSLTMALGEGLEYVILSKDQAFKMNTILYSGQQGDYLNHFNGNVSKSETEHTRMFKSGYQIYLASAYLESKNGTI